MFLYKIKYLKHKHKQNKFNKNFIIYFLEIYFNKLIF